MHVSGPQHVLMKTFLLALVEQCGARVHCLEVMRLSPIVIKTKPHLSGHRGLTGAEFLSSEIRMEKIEYLMLTATLWQLKDASAKRVEGPRDSSPDLSPLDLLETWGGNSQDPRRR